MTTPVLLVVDDDPELRELTATYLGQQGFTVHTVGDGREMDVALETLTPDLLVLDLMLPGEDGLSIAKRLKADRDLPIVILSAQGEDIDRIVGLEVGADDYLAKPFNPRELLARVRAVLRRAQSMPVGFEETRREYRFGAYLLDGGPPPRSGWRRGSPHQRRVRSSCGAGPASQSGARPGSAPRFIDRCRAGPFDRSIDVRVTRLRSKIEADPTHPAFIKTVWGKGYMFCPDSAA